MFSPQMTHARDDSHADTHHQIPSNGMTARQLVK